MRDPEKVNLANIGGGVAGELFERELGEVLKNITDINSDPKAIREIKLNVKIKPTDSRDVGLIEISCTSKLAGAKPVSSSIFIVDEVDQLNAYQKVQKQTELDFSNVEKIKEEENVGQ